MKKLLALWWIRLGCALALIHIGGFSFPADEGMCVIPDIGPLGALRQVCSGLAVAEGPAPGPDGCLYFSEIHRDNGRIWKLTPAGRLEIFISNTGKANGLKWSAQGELIACRMSGSVVAFSADGKSMRVLADNYCGRALNAPNDLVIDSHGGIYFTDPTFGCGLLPHQPGHKSVYYIAPCGTLTRVISNLPNPNGIVLAPDESTLYVVSTYCRRVQAYPILAPGELGPDWTFCRLQRTWLPVFVGGDGATIDVAGNLYVTSRCGVQVFDACGHMRGIIRVPECPTNVAFGGPGGRTLYITTWHSLYAAEMCIPGLPHPSWQQPS